MRSTFRIAQVILLFLLAVGLVLSPVRAAADSAMRLKVGEKAPDFRLKDVMTGKTVTLSEFAGKHVVMIEFWATWCDICKREMPSLVKLHGAWKPKGFELLSIVLPSGNVNDVKKIVQEKKLTYPVLLDADLSVATKLYGLAGPIPLKVVIDHKGIVRYSHVGDFPPGEDELPFVLEDLLKEMGKGK
jgi:cytochrome c biogenesis protein CcmG/thiol:disulfide interchange protein DsbE